MPSYRKCIVVVFSYYLMIIIIRDVKFVFLKFKLRLLKFELNLNFVYVLDLNFCEISRAHYSQPNWPFKLHNWACCSATMTVRDYSCAEAVFLMCAASIRQAFTNECGSIMSVAPVSLCNFNAHVSRIVINNCFALLCQFSSIVSMC